MEYVNSMVNGATDIFRGLAGMDTGEETKQDFEVHDAGPLGVSLNAEGFVVGVEGGSPACTHGLRLGDRVTQVNDDVVEGDVAAFLEGMTDRPMKASTCTERAAARRAAMGAATRAARGTARALHVHVTFAQ